MSDRFEDLLSAVSDSAAGAAREPGAAAARKRGHERRNRRRLAASTLSLALLGGIGVAAATTVHGSPKVPTASSTSTATPSLPASPSPAGSPSASPSQSPTATNTGTPTASTSTSPSAPPSTPASSMSSSAASGVVVVASPGAYVAGAWLSVEQLPLYEAGVTDWVDDGYNEGSHLGGYVYLAPSGSPRNWCDDVMSYSGNLTSLESGLTGTQYQGFTGPNGDKILANGTIPYLAAQDAYFYGDAAEARSAMEGLAGDFASCAAKLTGTDPTTDGYIVGSTEQTLAQSGAQCWSLLGTGKTPTANGGSVDHDCFVQSGNVIEEVHLLINQDGSFATQSFTAIDSTLVPELQHDLRAYPGN